MTVSAQETLYRHTGNGVTTTFAYGCQVLADGDLHVYVNGVEVLTGFTKNGIGSPSGGAVIFSVAPVNGAAIILERAVTLERTTDYQQNGDFLARVVNPDFDRLWMAIQQMFSGLSRALRVPKADVNPITEIPVAATRANNLLGFDSSGNPVAVVPSLQSAAAVLVTLATFLGSSLIGYIQAGTGAVVRTVQSRLRGNDVEIEDFGGVADGATSFATAAAAALTYLNSIGGGTLRFGRGIYVLNNNEKISLASGNITIRGQGIGVTTIKRVGAGTTALIESFSAVDKANICIQDMTIDCNSINSGIQVQYVSRFVVRNCAIINNGVWGLSVGIGNGASSTRVNKEVLITGCFFSNGKSTTENLLLFNSERVSVTDCFFKDGKTGGVFPALGLYQNLERVTISGCHFDALDRGLYYSLSANNLTIQGCTFQDCLTGIWGANTPDNGNFGTFNVFGLNVIGCQFMRCDNALEVGAVALGNFTDCIFTANINAVVINYGNTPTNAQPSSLTFSGCQFLNNNRLSGAAGLFPGVLFSGGGGAIAATFVGCHFLDNQAVKTQFTCVAFQGAFAWSAIKFYGCSLAYQGAGASLAIGGGASLSNVTLYGCMNLSGLPAGVTTA